MSLQPRRLLLLLGMTLLGLAFWQSIWSGAAAIAASPPRPHILWLMNDEHRWDAIRAYGRHDWVRSPNLDRLAAEGTLFREAYCQSPLCVASRVSILTGRYPHHTGVYGFEYSHAQSPFAVPFFTELLHQNGYYVANFGKQHHNRVASKDRPLMPSGKWYNLLSAFSDKDVSRLNDLEEARPSELLKGVDREQELGVVRRYLTEKKLILAGTNPVSASETLTAQLSDMAIRFLQSEAPQDRPVLLRVSYIAPHTPHLPPAPFDRMYDPAMIPLPEVGDEEIASFGTQTRQAYENLRIHGMKEAEIRQIRAHYYGLASFVDQEMGRVIGEFKRFCGDQPWLIIFHPDHACKLGEHGMHEKFTFYDESVHVPLIVASSDGRFSRGLQCKELVELVDIAPTMLAAAGVSCPAQLEGRDLAEVAQGRVPPRIEAISEKLTYGRRAMLRTERWSFEMQVSPEPLKARRLTPKEMTWAATRPLEELDVSLFDRQNDPSERHNLGHDPRWRATCEGLRKRLVTRIFPPDRVEYDWSRDLPPLKR